MKKPLQERTKTTHLNEEHRARPLRRKKNNLPPTTTPPDRNIDMRQHEPEREDTTAKENANESADKSISPDDDPTSRAPDNNTEVIESTSRTTPGRNTNATSATG